MRSRVALALSGVVLGAVTLAFADDQPETWQGLQVVEESKMGCPEPYDSDDYPYPQKIELDIIEDLKGIWSPYDLQPFSDRGKTHIEHIVARSEAHESGLCHRGYSVRCQFARDMDNLTLADPILNSKKGKKDAEEWQPDYNKCWFAGRVIAVKLEYGLTINKKERDKLEELLMGCEQHHILRPSRTPPELSDGDGPAPS